MFVFLSWELQDFPAVVCEFVRYWAKSSRLQCMHTGLHFAYWAPSSKGNWKVGWHSQRNRLLATVQTHLSYFHRNHHILKQQNKALLHPQRDPRVCTFSQRSIGNEWDVTSELPLYIERHMLFYQHDYMPPTCLIKQQIGTLELRESGDI